MLKVILFTLSILTVNFLTLDANRNSGNEQKTVFPKPTASLNSTKLQSLYLSKKILRLACPPGIKTPAVCSDDLNVDVSVKTDNKNNDALIYRYTVTGGIIIGQDENVKWDLSGVRPGTYKITAEVADNCGFCGEPVSKTVEVYECDACGCGYCECPTISLDASHDSAKPGELMTFTANVSGGSQTDVEYFWTVENGNIVEGQKTPSVKINSLPKKEPVIVTLKLNGLCGVCADTKSYTVKIAD